jgi:hypothetical protein
MIDLNGSGITRGNKIVTKNEQGEAVQMGIRRSSV